MPCPYATRAIATGEIYVDTRSHMPVMIWHCWRFDNNVGFYALSGSGCPIGQLQRMPKARFFASYSKAPDTPPAA